MSDVRLTFGAINLPAASATLACFKVDPPFSRSTAINTGRVKNKDYMQSTRFKDIGKGFTSATVAHPEGSIIMLKAGRTRGGVRIADAAIFLRLRDTAALRHITMRLPLGEESLLGDSMIAFTGKADILSVEELRPAQIDIPRSFVTTFMDQAEIDELFIINVISPELESAPRLQRVITSQGEQMMALPPEPVRRVRTARR